MELTKVKEFIVFSKYMSFTVAANELHLSQPSLSKHVHDLETELGVLLVNRGVSGTGNELTPAGMYFIEHVQKLIGQFDTLADECKELGKVLPPARIHDVHHGFNVIAQLRSIMEEAGEVPGNFTYVKTGASLCDALDHGDFDFGVHIEAHPSMKTFAQGGLDDIYGWYGLNPEPLCLLVGIGNPLFGKTRISASDLVSSTVICGDSLSYESWFTAVQELFARQSCPVTIKGVPDSALSGGAYPIGSSRFCLCTRRFADYYRDNGAEVVSALDVDGLELTLYPFLVYRKDVDGIIARRIIDCFDRLSENKALKTDSMAN